MRCLHTCMALVGARVQASCSMDLLASIPPERKKQKIGEHGESPQLTAVTPEVAHSTDVKNEPDMFEEAHGLVWNEDGWCAGRRTGRGKKFKRKGGTYKKKSMEQCLKKWGLAKEFTVCGGSRLGCITCMKYDAWHEQDSERADMKKKKKKNKRTKKKETKKVKSPRKSHGSAVSEAEQARMSSCDTTTPGVPLGSPWRPVDSREGLWNPGEP